MVRIQDPGPAYPLELLTFGKLILAKIATPKIEEARTYRTYDQLLQIANSN